MQQNQGPIIIMSALLVFLVYQEIRLLIMYIKYRHNGNPASAELIKVFQPHDSNPIYKIKIKDLNLDYAKHRIKTTILSSFFPRFFGGEFKIYYLADNDYCIVANPLMIIIDWILISLYILLMYKLF
jgi:hypothetical protein